MKPGPSAHEEQDHSSPLLVVGCGWRGTLLHMANGASCQATGMAQCGGYCADACGAHGMLPWLASVTCSSCMTPVTLYVHVYGRMSLVSNILAILYVLSLF